MNEIKNESESQDIELNWKNATPPLSIQYIDLNEDSFFDAMMEIINA